MSHFTTVAKVGEIEEGCGKAYRVGDRLVAVFLLNGQYHAIDDLCPHMGESLSAGNLDAEGIVTCPQHAWRFNVCNGCWQDNPRIRTDTFEVQVVDDEIQVGNTPTIID